MLFFVSSDWCEQLSDLESDEKKDKESTVQRIAENIADELSFVESSMDTCWFIRLKENNKIIKINNKGDIKRRKIEDTLVRIARFSLFLSTSPLSVAFKFNDGESNLKAKNQIINSIYKGLS